MQSTRDPVTVNRIITNNDSAIDNPCAIHNTFMGVFGRTLSKEGLPRHI